MKAPNKIYVREYPDGSFNPAWETKRKDDPTTVLHEYVSKDALLEWLQLERKKRKGLSLIYWGMRTAFGQVVDKIKSM